MDNKDSPYTTLAVGLMNQVQNQLSRSFYLPYLVLGALHLPLWLIYIFRDLMSDLRAHYHFFPFLYAAVAYLIWDRWPRQVENPLRSSSASTVFYLGSCLVLAVALVFLQPVLTCLSLALGVSSFLLRIKDPTTGGSLFPISALLYVLVRTPFDTFSEDRKIITMLQQWSARITSVLLDLVGVVHDMPGTILMTPERSWGVEEACSGVQSFYTLLFASVFMAVWFRRTALRAVVLVGSSVFWALTMNTFRIFLIPIAHVTVDWDLSTGWQHAALGYLTLILGIVMIWSTDQFLEFLLGSFDSEKSGSETEMSAVGRFWNRFVAGRSQYTSQEWMPSPRSSYGLLAMAGLPLLTTVFLLPDLFRLVSAQGGDFFRSNVVMKVDEAWFPAELDGWILERYDTVNRKAYSDLGQRSDVWHYRNKNLSVLFSFDQAFPGWHELTICYQNSEIGWQIVNGDLGRTKFEESLPSVDAEGESELVSYVQVELFAATSGDRGFLVFGLDDPEGVQVPAPGNWSDFSAFFERLKGRFAQGVRASFFRSEGYQTQVFCSRNVSDEDRAAIKNFYLKLRAIAKAKIREAKRNQQFWTAEELESMMNAEKAKEAAKKSKGEDSPKTEN
ncbi:MAG: exosortase U [Planctomycetaceae bacterium]|nr:exosortase U [Planctomycetaceae bacterium]